MKKKRKNKSVLLCMKYATSCKYCPKNAKCEEEIKKVKLNEKRYPK